MLTLERDSGTGQLARAFAEADARLNCINMGRQDALPPVPEKMAVRTARHVYLYIRMRCIRQGRLQA